MADKLFRADPSARVLSWGDEPHRVSASSSTCRPTSGRRTDTRSCSIEWLGVCLAHDHALLVRTSEAQRTGRPGGARVFDDLADQYPYTFGGNYLLRTDPARRAEILKAAVGALEKNGPQPHHPRRQHQAFEDLRIEYYRQDRAMVWMLVAVIVALLVVTALGIVGLASFWVQQRTKQIGVRRALGATRGQILRYFQTENFLLATIGIVLGMLFAYGINQLLMGKYELPRLPLIYLPVGAVLLWLLGQIAVYGPARKAASVPPAVATRSA